jgi:hypothetical protein
MKLGPSVNVGGCSFIHASLGELNGTVPVQIG